MISEEHAMGWLGVMTIGTERSSRTSTFYSLVHQGKSHTRPGKEPNWYLFSGPEQDVLRHAIPSRVANIRERAVSRASDYDRLFDGYANQPIRLEASPVYLHLPGVEKNISRNNPEAKLLVINRDRVDLLFSMYSVFLKRPPDLFEQFLFAPDDREERDALVSFSDVDCHIARYRAEFGDERLLEIDFDRLTAETEQVIEEICSFLGIRTVAGISLAQMNASGQFRDNTAGKLFSGIEARKNAIRRLIPRHMKKLAFGTYHALRNRSRKRPPTVSVELRDRIHAELFAKEETV